MNWRGTFLSVLIIFAVVSSASSNTESISPIFGVPLKDLLEIGRAYSVVNSNFHVSEDAHPDFLRDDFLHPAPNFWSSENARYQWNLHEIAGNQGQQPLVYVVINPPPSYATSSSSKSVSFPAAYKEDVEKSLYELNHQRSSQGGVVAFCLEEAHCTSFRELKEKQLPYIVVPAAWFATRVESDSMVDTKMVMDAKPNLNIKSNSRIMPYLLAIHLLKEGFTIYHVDSSLKINLDLLRIAKRFMKDNNHTDFFGLVDSVNYREQTSAYQERNTQPQQHQQKADIEGEVDATAFNEMKYLEPFVSEKLFIAKPTSLTIRLFELVVINLLKRPEVDEQQIINEAMDILGMKINGINNSKAKFWNCGNFRVEFHWK